MRHVPVTVARGHLDTLRQVEDPIQTTPGLDRLREQEWLLLARIAVRRDVRAAFDAAARGALCEHSVIEQLKALLLGAREGGAA